MPDRKCSISAFCTSGSLIPCCTFCPVRGFTRIHKPSEGPRWICTQMSESGGTSLRLVQLRSTPRIGTRRNLPSEGAKRRSNFARRLGDSAIYFSTRKLPRSRASIPELKKGREGTGGVWEKASPPQVEEGFIPT